ncbi:tail fiber protein [Verrucomicrobium sp. BvORR106]|uniref:tail fiber protein n=1 Tax=Verrucomicrobium sp. BvORR106 TaxID=1403819 RepID=UPI00068AA920|nr:tail fiber protein [Verrucomicrobium sp. BvORR106]
MAVQSGTSAAIYTGNSSTVTPYPVPFPYLLASDIYVAVQQGENAPVILAQGADYTLTPTKDSGGNIVGGQVVTKVAYNNTRTLTIFRQVALTQLTELPEAGPISSRTLEKAYDKATMALQQIHRRVLALEGIDDGGSVIVIPEGSTGDVLQDVQTFADATTRGNAIPKRVGQLGVQIDNGSLWRSIGTSAGSWARQTAEAVEQATVIAGSAVASYLPPGCIVPYGGTTAPTGWLFCYGQAVSRSAYAGLFTALGTTYGAGDGTTTFNLPDLRGRVAAGRDDMGGASAGRLTNAGTGNPGVNGTVLGAAGGADRHMLTVAQMPSHTHNITNGSVVYRNAAPLALAGGSSNWGQTVNLTNESTGGGESHPNLQPSLVLNYIVRV